MTRRATLADLDAVARLFDAYRQFYEQPADIQRARNFMSERLAGTDAVVFIAEREGAAVGFVQLYPLFSSVSARRIWLLNDMFVAPAARRGIGRELLECARQHAKQTGALRLELTTAHTNAAAQRLYESAGYVRDDDFAHYSLRVDGPGTQGTRL